MLSGGNEERLGFGAGLRVSRGEDVGEGDADSTAVIVQNAKRRLRLDFLIQELLYSFCLTTERTVLNIPKAI